MSTDQHNSQCEMCGVGGDLLCCDTCTLVYHLKCLKPPLKKLPAGEWQCPTCLEEAKTSDKRTRGGNRKKTFKIRPVRTLPWSNTEENTTSSNDKTGASPSSSSGSAKDIMTMTEVEAFPVEKYTSLFKLLVYFHKNKQLNMSTLKQLKDLIVVGDIRTMTILTAAKDVFEANEKDEYDVLFCVDTFERVFLQNFPMGFQDLDAIERKKQRAAMKAALDKKVQDEHSPYALDPVATNQNILASQVSQIPVKRKYVQPPSFAPPVLGNGNDGGPASSYKSPAEVQSHALLAGHNRGSSHAAPPLHALPRTAMIDEKKLIDLDAVVPLHDIESHHEAPSSEDNGVPGVIDRVHVVGELGLDEDSESFEIFSAAVAPHFPKKILKK